MIKFRDLGVQSELPPSLLEILLFATRPCVTTSNQMSPMIINGCLCNYFSNLDEVMPQP
jgi:hypothetical protein